MWRDRAYRWARICRAGENAIGFAIGRLQALDRWWTVWASGRQL